MDAILAKAIEKAAGPLCKGLNLVEGSYAVDETVTIHVSGVIKKGADETYVPTVDIPLKAALALVLEKAGVTRDAAAKMLVEAMTEALSLGAKGGGAVKERLNDIDVAMGRVAEAVAKLPEKTRSGKTMCKVTLEVVEPAFV